MHNRNHIRNYNHMLPRYHWASSTYATVDDPSIIPLIPTGATRGNNGKSCTPEDLPLLRRCSVKANELTKPSLPAHRGLTWRSTGGLQGSHLEVYRESTGGLQG
eukprot:1182998-Prorocentrum_minimum.AAC.1